MKSQSSRLRSLVTRINDNQPSYLILRAYRRRKLRKQLRESQKVMVQPTALKPLRLMLAVFIINALAIATTINVIRPKAYSNFELQDVQIQQVDTRDETIVSGVPARLQIDTADVDIEVASGGYDTERRTWDLSKDKAHYADITPQANNKVGNTFIYGHNRREVFASLENVSVGDQAIVHTTNGKTFTYTLRSIVDVEPTDVSLFEYQGSSILTVQTCSGNWFEKRRLYTFDFTEVI